MTLLEDYFATVTGLMARLLDEEAASLEAASEAVAEAIAADKLLHVFGPGGHSALGAEEIFYRAGGLVAVNAMLDDGVMLGGGALRSMLIERTPGYAKVVLHEYGLAPGDLLLIVNAYGVNACTVEAAIVARELGAKTIGVTSRSLQEALPQGHPSRHPNGRNLADLVDICVDCKVPMGDALISVPGVTQRAGSSSTFLNALALNAITLGAIGKLAERGIDPPIWQSANSPGGDAANARHLERYRGRIKKL